MQSFQLKPTLPENFQEKSVERLRKAVVAIQQATPIDATLEELYQSVENLCSHGMAEKVYQALKALVETYVQDCVQQFLGESLDKLIFMKKMNDCWSGHCRQMIMIRSIFLFLDRTYVLQHPSVMSIWELGLDTFRRCILTNQLGKYYKMSKLISRITGGHRLKNCKLSHFPFYPVQTRTVDGILMLIEQERHGDMVDRSLLKSLLRMLSDLQIYKDAFEKKFLLATEKLYAAEGQRLINERDIPEYLNHVERRIKEENERLVHYLDPSSKWQLIHMMEKQLLSEHLSTILTKGLDDLLETNRKPELLLMYSLLGRVSGGHDELKGKLCDYVKKRGRLIVVNPEKDKTMVQELLDFKQKLDTIMQECFKSNETFIVSMKESCESFINTRQNKPAELIAKFVDSKLRAGNKEASEEELEKLLDKIMVIFRYVTKKIIQYLHKHNKFDFNVFKLQS